MSKRLSNISYDRAYKNRKTIETPKRFKQLKTSL